VIEEKPIAALLFLQARLPFSLSPLGLASGQFPRSAASLESSSPAESPAFVTAFLGYAYGASGDQVRAMAEMEDLKKDRCMIMFYPSTWRLCISVWVIANARWIAWNGYSVENDCAGICGSYSPQPTLVLDEKPVEKHGPEVTYRSVVTSALAMIPFRSLLVS
jgi:hypothetical protein